MKLRSRRCKSSLATRQHRVFSATRSRSRKGSITPLWYSRSLFFPFTYSNSTRVFRNEETLAIDFLEQSSTKNGDRSNGATIALGLAIGWSSFVLPRGSTLAKFICLGVQRAQGFLVIKINLALKKARVLRFEEWHGVLICGERDPCRSLPDPS